MPAKKDIISCLLLYWYLFNISKSHSLASVTDTCSIVTGANGYVGRAIVHELLHRGQEDIICLVRAHHVEKEETYWRECSRIDASSSIRVLPYDMLDNGISLKHALDKSKSARNRFVYHVASVFGPTSDHRQTALDNVKGTEDLVRAIAKEGNCKLILTSSMAAVRGTGQVPSNGKFYTSDDWNTVSQLGASWGESYQWSKATSEKRAWELSKELRLPMVSLCPSFVFGPPSSKSSSYSVTLVNQWVRGQSPVQSRLFVDIRDCAKAHAEAGMRDVATGRRYILSTESRVPSKQIAGWLQDACRYTKLSDPKLVYYDANFDGGAIQIGEKEVDAVECLKNDLCVVLRSVEETIFNMAKILLE